MKIQFKILISSFLMFLLYTTSCKDYNTNDSVDCNSYDYSDCITSEPYDGRIYIKLTINDENLKVPIAIYQGKLEDNVLFMNDTVDKDQYDTLLPIDNYYTVTAEYRKNGKRIFAVDGDNIKKSHADVCDSVCWNVKTGNVNVRLK